MEQSNQTQEILKLGRKIVEQLGQENSRDVLGNWLSYYLADLMNKAIATEDEPKQALDRECLDAILKIWDHRANLPRNVRPLAELEPAVRLLYAIGDASDKNFPPFLFLEDPWQEAGAAIYEKGRLMMGLLLYRQTIHTNWPKVSAWKDELPTLVPEEEAVLIDGIQAMTAHIGYYYGLDKLEKDPVVISKAIIEKLREELKRQLDTVDELEKAVVVHVGKQKAKSPTCKSKSESDQDSEWELP